MLLSAQDFNIARVRKNRNRVGFEHSCCQGRVWFLSRFLTSVKKVADIVDHKTDEDCVTDVKGIFSMIESLAGMHWVSSELRQNGTT